MSVSTKVNDELSEAIIDERLEDTTDSLEAAHAAIIITDLTVNTDEEAKNPSEPLVDEPHDLGNLEDTTIRRTRNKKIFIALCLLCVVAFVIVDTFTTGYVKSALKSLLTWIDENPMLGFFVFMLVYMLSVGELTAKLRLPWVSASSQVQLLTFPTFPSSPSNPWVDFNSRGGLCICQGIWFGTGSCTRFAVRLPGSITGSHD